jgi:phage baseplate assembly protein W
MSGNKTTNIDFDVLENSQVYDSISESQQLIDSNTFVPSDDALITRFPTLSVKLPVDKNSTNPTADGYQMIRGYESLVMQNFKNLMLTSPGEKIMDPNFGVGLRRFLFEQLTSDEPKNIRGRIVSQVKRYLSYVTILNINIQPEPDENRLGISISYQINPLNTSQIFNYSVSGQSNSTLRGLL